MNQDQAISPIHKEEDQEGIDLEMEDAENEEEKELIRAERALHKKNETPFSRQVYEKEDERTLADLACQLCDDQEQEDQQEEGAEAVQPKAIWKPIRPTVKEVEEHNLTHLPFRNWCIFCVKGKATYDPHRRKYDGCNKNTLLVSTTCSWSPEKPD